MVVFIFRREKVRRERRGGRAGYEEGRSTEMAGYVLWVSLVDLKHEAMLLYLRCIKSIPSPSLVVAGWSFSETERDRGQRVVPILAGFATSLPLIIGGCVRLTVSERVRSSKCRDYCYFVGRPDRLSVLYISKQILESKTRPLYLCQNFSPLR